MLDTGYRGKTAGQVRSDMRSDTLSRSGLASCIRAGERESRAWARDFAA